MTHEEVFRQAAEVIRGGAFCKRSLARTSDGWRVFPDHPEADRWCVMGITLKISGKKELGQTEHDCLLCAAKNLGFLSEDQRISSTNDQEAMTPELAAQWLEEAAEIAAKEADK